MLKEKAVKKTSVKKIVQLKEKDMHYRQGAKEHGVLKFFNIEKYMDYTTLSVASDLRPLKSEIMNWRNIIFT